MGGGGGGGGGGVAVKCWVVVWFAQTPLPEKHIQLNMLASSTSNTASTRSNLQAEA